MTARQGFGFRGLCLPSLFGEAPLEHRDRRIERGFLRVGQAVRTCQRNRRRRHGRQRGIDQCRRHRSGARRSDDGVDRCFRGVDQFFDGFTQLLGRRPRGTATAAAAGRQTERQCAHPRSCREFHVHEHVVILCCCEPLLPQSATRKSSGRSMVGRCGARKASSPGVGRCQGEEVHEANCAGEPVA